MNPPLGRLYICLLCICCKAIAQPAGPVRTQQKASLQQADSVHARIVSLLQKGTQYEFQKDYHLSIDAYLQAIRIAETQRAYRDIHTAYGCLLNMYYYGGDYAGAMEIAQKGLLLAGQQNDSALLAHYDEQFGFIYLQQQEPEESIRYYRQYLDLATGMNQPLMLAHAYACLAEVYLQEQACSTSLRYLFNALAIYKRSDSLQRQAHKDDSELAGIICHTFYQLSCAYKKAGNTRLAMQYAVNGFTYRPGNTIPSCNKYDLAGYYINAGELYMALAQYGRAITLLHQGLALSRSIIHRESIRVAYKGLSQLYARQHRYDSAYHYLQLYTALKDSLLNEHGIRAIEQVRSRFVSDRKDEEIALLKREQEVKVIASRNRNLLFVSIAGFSVSLALAAFVILYIRNRQKKQELYDEKRLAIQVERQRISGDMHDEIGTSLSTMLLHVNMLKAKLAGAPDYPAIEKVSTLGHELATQLREIVWSFHPGNDTLESLLVFIRQYFAQLFEPLDYATNLVFPEPIPPLALNGIIRRNIYLCTKEALNNVIKHAHARRIEMAIRVSQEQLTITVRDDGTGFPGDPEEQSRGNGLKSMQSRMDQVGGSFRYFNEAGAVVVIGLGLSAVPQKALV
jgi:two-component system NarL family sensor kinase